jgi:DNA-binding transcriptional regulator YiaG
LNLQIAYAARGQRLHFAKMVDMKTADFSHALSVLGWSQAKFAERMGVDPTTVSRWTGAQKFPKWVGEYLRLAVLVKGALD